VEVGPYVEAVVEVDVVLLGVDPRRVWAGSIGPDSDGVQSDSFFEDRN
jgi:hypothetical protein